MGKKNIFNILKSKLKLNGDHALDTMDSRDKIREEFRQNRNKKLVWFGVAVVIVFIILVLISAFNSYRDSTLAYTKQEERKNIDIKTDNFAIWQAGAEQKMNDLEKTVEQKFTEQGIDISNIKDSLKDIKEALVTAFKKSKNDTDDIAKKVLQIQQSLMEEIQKINTKLQNQESSLETAKEELNKLFSDTSNALKGDLENLKIQVGEVKIAENTTTSEKATGQTGFPIDNTENQKNIEHGNKDIQKDIGEDYTPSDKVMQKIKVTIEEKEADNNNDSEIDNQKPITFKVLLGLSKGILLNGADASIIGFGRQEEAPVAISLLSKVSIANGEYSNLKDCLLLGSAVGSMTTERAQIRLEKISCIFTNQEGDKFLAEGAVKGWVTDENGSLGVSGGLITQEGKIIRASLPIAAIQTALDYVTRRATNVVIPTGGGLNGYSNFNAAFGSGSSSAANTTLGKITQIYEKMIQAQVPVINFKPGREITVLFQGGEEITLVPYKDQQGLGEMENEFLNGQEKYNYQEANNVFMEEN